MFRIEMLLHIPLNAQNLYFKTYTTSDGLLQNSIYSIAQTDEGFMWFGSQHGLNRFDGKKMAQVDMMPSSYDSHDFSKMFTAMHYDRYKNFWIGTAEQLLWYDRYKNVVWHANDKFQNLKLDGNAWVEQLYTDNTNHLWIKTKTKLYCYNLEEKCMETIDLNDVEYHTIALSPSFDGTKLYLATENNIYTCQGEKITLIKQNVLQQTNAKIKHMVHIQNNIWLLSNENKVYQYNLLNDKEKIVSFENYFKGESALKDPSILHRANEHTLWMGSRADGILIADTKSLRVQRSGNTYHNNALSSNFVLSFFTDNQDNTWIGLSGGGVAKFNYNNLKFGLWRNEVREGEQMVDNMIMSMHYAGQGHIYCGTLFGGLLHVNTKDDQYTYYQPPRKSNNATEANNIYTIVEGEKGNLWMATWGGLCSFNTRTKKMVLYNDKDNKTIQLATLIKLKNKLLVGGYKMGLRMFDLRTEQWSPCLDPYHVLYQYDLRPRHLYALSDDEVLIASETQSMVKYNLSSGRFTFYPQFQDVSMDVRHFCITSKYWWIGTNDGLIQASAIDQSIIKIWNKTNGLPDNVCYSVQQDVKGYIWVGSNAGLTRINPESSVCTKYNENDGLQSLEFNTASCCMDEDRNLWFGGIRGFNKVQNNVIEESYAIPKPLVTSINLLNDQWTSDTMPPYLQQLHISHKNSYLNIEFQCPLFSQADNIIYKYRLLPIDTSWIINGNKNYITYAQLNSGEYTFEIKAANANLQWSDQTARIYLDIATPWYKTKLFYLAILGMLSYMGYRMYKQRLNTLRKEADIKHKISATEMAALKAQMNPHFIFNCINSIDAYIQNNDKYNASFYLNKFAKLIRNILDSSKHNTVSLQRDIDTIKLYIEMEEMRNDNKFKTSYDIDEDIYNYDISVPPLIIQPYVENAIIHGLRNREGSNGLLHISIHRSDDYLHYVITDNGIGRAAAAHISRKKDLSYGMQLSADRIRLFNENDQGQIEVVDQYDADGKSMGTTIKLRLKIN